MTSRFRLPARAGLALAAAVIFLFPVFDAGWRAYSADRERLLLSVDDDTYYYLLPAFRLAQEGTPSFDGRHPTYGFQPLWFLVCAGLATIADTREDLLRLALLASSAAMSVAGALLWRWAGGRRPGWASLLGIGATWSLSFPMLQTYWKAKENGAHAMVLAGLLLAFQGARRPDHRVARAVGLGILLGLLVLARMNAFPLALVGLGGLAWIDRHQADRVRRLALAASAGLLVVTPWFLLAHHWFGVLWPTSGTAKLAQVSLSAAAARLFTLDFLRSLRVLFESVGGFAALALVLAAALCAASAAGRTGLVRRFRIRAPGLLFLAAYAAFTHASTFALLRAYFDYATWYRVPQHFLLPALLGILLPRRRTPPLPGTAWVAGTGGIVVFWVALHIARSCTPWLEPLARLLADTIHPWFAHGLRGHLPHTLVISALVSAAALWFLRRNGKAAGLILLLALLQGTRSAYLLQAAPRAHIPAPGTTGSDILDACRFIEASLKPGLVLAGANCGISGYALENHTVINLDGLANAPGFLSVMSSPERLRQYFAEQQIAYFVDVFRLTELAPEGRPLDCLRPEEVEPVWVSPHVIPHWGGARVAVLKLRDSFSP